MKKERTAKGKKFRKWMKVRSIYEPELVFVIERSAVPDRIYYGANRWWTKNEIQALGEPENPATSLRLNGKGKMREDGRKCAEGVSRESAAGEWLPERGCLECGAIFQPTRPWARFHSEPCRRAYWKRQGRLRAKTKTPQESAATVEESMIMTSQASAGDGMTAHPKLEGNTWPKERQRRASP